MQNLRRFCGYDVQYFAAVEPQRRLAPHIHLAIRGTISRAELRAGHRRHLPPGLVAVHRRRSGYDGDHVPVWDEHAGTYLDPDTGEVLPTWDEALDAIGDQDEPLHVVRFGDRFDAQGVLAGSRSQPVHRLPDQVPDQARRRLPPGRPPTPRPRTPTGSPTRCATSRARRPARTGSATASSPRTPGRACARAAARARPTAASTSATPGGASWSPANGPARRWPTTAPTARPG